MSAEEQSMSVDEMADQEVDKNGKKSSIFNWNGNKFVKLKEKEKEETSKKLAKFVYANVAITTTKELPAVSLELNNGELHLIFNGNDDKVVKVIHVNKERRCVTIITSTSKFKGSVNQILKIRNADSKNTQDNPKTTDLFEFIYGYKMTPEIENESPKAAEEPTPRKRSRKESTVSTPKSPILPPKVPRLSVGQVEKENLSKLKNRLSQIVIPEHETRYLALGLLENDSEVATPSEANVNVILQEIRNQKWKESTPLIVNKPSDSESYYVFNGNAQLAAFKRFNEETSDNTRHIQTVNCSIYKNLDFDMKAMVNAQIQNSKIPESETIIQQTKLLLTTLKNNGVPQPTSKNEIPGIVEVADLYLPKNYPLVCVELLMLSEDTLFTLFETSVKDVPLGHIKISANFWKKFITAAIKNPTAALELINELENKTVEDVEKLFKNVEIDLLEFLKKRGPHNFQSEEDAIEKLTGKKDISKDDLIKALKAETWLHNRKRDGPNWDGIATKITAHFDNNIVSGKTTFIGELDDTLLSKQNFIVCQNLSTELKNVLEKFNKSFTLLSFGNLREDPPHIPAIEPTAIFKVLFQDPVSIDKVIDYLPKASVKAHLYIPNAPQNCNQKLRHQFLSQLALEKQVPLADDLKFEHCHEIAKLASSYENILFCNTSVKITQHFLSNLNIYQHVYVTGNDELKELVETCFTEAEKIEEIITAREEIVVEDNQEENE